jgi:hypothetical protein
VSLPARDAIDVGMLVLGFAALVTAHLATLVGLAARRPRWHAPLALLLPPLAPYWAVRQGMLGRAVIWIASGALYAVARVLSVG